jgi:CheY-like chemotaxis protein/signal transduction histidine kinase
MELFKKLIDNENQSIPLDVDTGFFSHLHEILKRLHDILFFVDQKGNVLYVNQCDFDLQTADKQETTLIHNLMPKNCGSRLKAALEQTFSTSKSQQFEYLSNINQWWRITIQPVLSGPDIQHAVIVFSEITRLKHYEKIVQLHELALKQLSVEFTITNETGRILYTIQESDEKIGHLHTLFKRGKASKQTQEPLWDTLNRGEIWINTREETDNLGRVHRLETTVLPVLDTEQTLTHYLIIRRDLTRTSSSENELREQIDQLRFALQQKENNTEIFNQVIEQLTTAKDQARQTPKSDTNFLAELGHEIRTPINSVASMLHLLNETSLNPAQKQYINITQESIRELNILVNDMINLNQVDSGSISLETRNFSLHQLLIESLRSLSVIAAQKQIDLILDTDPETPDQLEGDPTRIRQILINLLDNALKFTEEGEIVLRARLETDVNQHCHLHLTVTDTGIGIPMEKQDNIFHAFVQGNSASPPNAGTGLGLYISSQLVKMLQGKLWVESPLNSPHLKGGPGSAFHCVLACARDRTEPKSVSRQSDTHTNPILIVEHNLSQRNVLVKWLSAGFRPIVVKNSKAALAAMHRILLQQNTVPWVIIDAELKLMDGFKLAETILQDGELADSIMMMLSPLDLQAGIDRCRILGIEYMVKPLNPAALFEQLIQSADAGPGEHQFEKTACSVTDENQESRTTGEENIRILVVDDDKVTCQVLEHQLSQFGWQVCIIKQGTDALRTLEKEDYHLILMEIQLPGINGFELTAAIRDREQKLNRPPVPIIAVTARTMPGDRQQCLEAGMTDYLPKPIQSDILTQCIEKHLNQFLDESHSSAETALNLTKALNTYNGDSQKLLMKIESFIGSFPEKITQLRRFIQNNQMERLEIEAKKLKIDGRMIGAITLYRLADRLETMGWKSDRRQAGEVIKYLEKAFHDLQNFIEQINLSETLHKSLKSYRILVIEDNVSYQEFMRSQLEAHGYEILLAKDGLEGLDLARLEKPDLIILDLMLPQINGHAVTHMLKLDRNCQQIPIMILTCRNIKKDEEIAQKGGADVFLLKSTKTEKILFEIKRLINETANE